MPAVGRDTNSGQNRSKTQYLSRKYPERPSVAVLGNGATWIYSGVRWSIDALKTCGRKVSMTLLLYLKTHKLGRPTHETLVAAVDGYSRLVEVEAWTATGSGGGSSSAMINWLVTDQVRLVFGES